MESDEFMLEYLNSDHIHSLSKRNKEDCINH